MIKHYIIPIFVPHLGCPHDCVFCNQKKITNSLEAVTKETVRETIEQYLSYFDKQAFIEVAFYGGSFTAIDIDLQRELLSVPKEYKEKGLINEIRLSTRPDSINEDILDVLKEYNVDTVELGVQSMDNNVLYKSGRGHDKDCVYKAVKLLKEYDIKFGLQMMIGLPEDNINTIFYTQKEFISLNPDCVRIYPTLVIKQTYLEDLYLNEKYKPLEVLEAVDISTVLLILFELNKIDVIRLGLQVTENIQMGKDVVSGPFHPAFRQLVNTNIYYKILNKYIPTNTKEVIIKINNKNISDVIGQKALNKERLISEKNIAKFKIYPTSLNINTMILILDGKEISIDILKEKENIAREYLVENKLNPLDYNL